MPLILITWVICGIAAAHVASNRGASGFLWFVLGMLLGPLGLALAFATGSKSGTCARCLKEVSWNAEACQHCGYVFEGAPLEKT